MKNRFIISLVVGAVACSSSVFADAHAILKERKRQVLGNSATTALHNTNNVQSSIPTNGDLGQSTLTIQQNGAVGGASANVTDSNGWGSYLVSSLYHYTYYPRKWTWGLSVEEKLAEASERYSEFNKSVEELRANISKFAQENNNFAAIELTELENGVKALGNTVEGKKVAWANAKATEQSLSQQVESLKQEEASLQSKLDELNKQVADMGVANAKNKAAISVQENLLSILQNTDKSLQEKLGGIQSSINELIDENKKNEDILLGLDETKKSLENILVYKIAAVASLNNTKAGLNEERIALDEKLSQFRLEIEAVDKENIKKIDDIRNLRPDVNEKHAIAMAYYMYGLLDAGCSVDTGMEGRIVEFALSLGVNKLDIPAIKQQAELYMATVLRGSDARGVCYTNSTL